MTFCVGGDEHPQQIRAAVAHDGAAECFQCVDKFLQGRVRGIGIAAGSRVDEVSGQNVVKAQNVEANVVGGIVAAAGNIGFNPRSGDALDGFADIACGDLDAFGEGAGQIIDQFGGFFYPCAGCAADDCDRLRVVVRGKGGNAAGFIRQVLQQREQPFLLCVGKRGCGAQDEYDIVVIVRAKAKTRQLAAGFGILRPLHNDL